MSAPKLHTLRVDDDAHKRALRLAPLLDPQIDAAGRARAPTSADALRVALSLGLQQLEAAAR